MAGNCETEWVSAYRTRAHSSTTVLQLRHAPAEFLQHSLSNDCVRSRTARDIVRIGMLSTELGPVSDCEITFL